MKKILAVVLSMLLLVLPAFADEPAPTEPADAETAPAVPDEPSLTYPKDRYGDIYMEETDGSEQTVFRLLDSMNDEEAAIAEYGSLVLTTAFFDDVYSSFTQTTRLFVIDGIRYMLITMSMEGTDADVNLLCVEGQYFSLSANGVSPIQKDIPGSFDELWGMWRFPYMPIDTLHGIRQTEGYTYYLVSGTDGSAIEYVTGDDMKIVESRVYYPDDTGELALFHVAWYSEEPLPEELLTYLPETTAAPDAA